MGSISGFFSSKQAHYCYSILLCEYFHSTVDKHLNVQFGATTNIIATNNLGHACWQTLSTISKFVLQTSISIFPLWSEANYLYSRSSFLICEKQIIPPSHNVVCSCVSREVDLTQWICTHLSTGDTAVNTADKMHVIMELHSSSTKGKGVGGRT